MSESVSKKTVTKSVKAKKTTSNKSKKSEIEDFKVWLGNLPSTPKLHVNGADYTSAVLTVDFGTPLEELPKLTNEQNAELVAKMKASTRSLFNKPDLNVRIQSDNNNGIWWATAN